MSQKNETPALLLSLLITLVLIGAGVWWFGSRLNWGNLLPGGSVSTPGSGQSGGGVLRLPGSSQNRLSVGERLLFPEGASAEKQAGIEAIAAGNYSQAVTDLERALAVNRNDPEARIYLNNARIANQSAYAIAVAVPTATAPGSALEILRGVAQAQTEVNQAGGINGQPLKVVLVSDDNDPTVAAQVAQTLVRNQEILGVIGHFGSDATLAAAPVYNDGGLVMISPTSTSVDLSGAGQFTFRTVPSDSFTAATLARYQINTLNRRNAAVFFNSESAYSASLKKEFTTAIATSGGQVLTEVDLKGAGFNAPNAVEQAIQQGADILVLLPNTAALDEALQVVAVNRRRLPIVGGDSVYNPRVLQIGGENAVGAVVAVPWVLLSNPSAPFVQSSRQLWGADVNWRTAMAYDASQVLITGLRTAPTRADLATTLRSNSFVVNGATGAVRFLPSGDRNQAMQLVVVEPDSRSSYGYSFLPVAE